MNSVKTGIFSSGITTHTQCVTLVRPPQVRAGHIRVYAAESVTGGPAVLNSVSCVLICHKVLVRLLNHFIQQFFGRTPRLRAILSSCLWIFPDSSAGRNHQHVHHAFFVAPGHFQLIKKNRFMLNPGGLEGGLVNFALFRLGLLSSKNCTCCSSSLPSYQTWRRRTSISAPG